MTAALVVAALVLGAVTWALVSRIAARLDRAAAVVCHHDTRVFDPARQQWVHRTSPFAPLVEVLVGRRLPRQPRPRRPPHVERARR